MRNVVPSAGGNINLHSKQLGTHTHAHTRTHITLKPNPSLSTHQSASFHRDPGTKVDAVRKDSFLWGW